MKKDKTPKEEKVMNTCECEDCHCKDGEECNCEDCNCEDCNCEDCHCEDCGEECDCGECDCNDCNCLEEENKQLREALKEAENKVLYERAEAINYRKRKDEEVAKMLKYCNEELIEEILPSIDNFERAISLDDTNLEDQLSKFLSGFKMIYCHINNALEKYGVKAIDGIDKPFDPTYHQAVLTEKVKGVKPGMVVEVMQKGYLLKDKVIRPAMVKVSE